jgi:predicted transcriptional regulator
MAKEAVFTMKLEAELRDAFVAEAASEDRPASQVLRELMRSYIDQRHEAREYDEYLRQMVERGRADMRAGRGRSNEDVEADFAARRAKLQRQIDETER